MYKNDDAIKWKHFPRYWPFVRGIHRSPVNSPHKGQWRGALMFSLICAWINGWVNNGGSGDLRRHRVHHDVTVMRYHCFVLLMEMRFMVLHLVCLICDWIVTVIYCDSFSFPMYQSSYVTLVIEWRHYSCFTFMNNIKWINFTKYIFWYIRNEIRVSHRRC